MIINVIFSGSEVRGIMHAAAKKSTKNTKNIQEVRRPKRLLLGTYEISFTPKEQEKVLAPHSNALVISLSLENCLTRGRRPNLKGHPACRKSLDKSCFPYPDGLGPLLGCMDPCLGPNQVRRSVSLWAKLINGRSNLNLNRTDCDRLGLAWTWSGHGRLLYSRLDRELRLIVVKPRSHEDSISERLCGVWVDRAGKNKSGKSRKSKKRLDSPVRPTLLGHIREMKMVNSIMSVKSKENPLTLTVIETSMRKQPMVQKIGCSTVHEGPVRGHEGDG
ncbi:hypothetical protein F2Q69_00006057 [Brassica cretica]|uniref:Uncharacterized protein n=1 Tax=Brassica cretica TaxID=69181 RepID=A0A8S9PAL5_BRACR|nr:hypothetical protein F2Q69_00006057 [Brassica cretica]